MKLLVFNHLFDLEKQLFYLVQPNITSPGNKCQKSTSEALLFLFMTLRTDLSAPLCTSTPPVLTVALRCRVSHLCVSANSTSKQRRSKFSDPGWSLNTCLKESYILETKPVMYSGWGDVCYIFVTSSSTTAGGLSLSKFPSQRKCSSAWAIVDLPK